MMQNGFRSESDNRQIDNEQLSALLRQWKAVEPQADFGAAVWRKIRSVTVTEVRRGSRIERFRGWVPMRPAWTTAAAAAGLIVGASMGFLSPRPVPVRPMHPLLHPRTVAGAYLSVATGEPR